MERVTVVNTTKVPLRVGPETIEPITSIEVPVRWYGAGASSGVKRLSEFKQKLQMAPRPQLEAMCKMAGFEQGDTVGGYTIDFDDTEAMRQAIAHRCGCEVDRLKTDEEKWVDSLDFSSVSGVGKSTAKEIEEFLLNHEDPKSVEASDLPGVGKSTEYAMKKYLEANR